jgi:hypothetical protein
LDYARAGSGARCVYRVRQQDDRHAGRHSFEALSCFHSLLNALGTTRNVQEYRADSASAQPGSCGCDAIKHFDLAARGRQIRDGAGTIGIVLYQEN